MKNWRIDLERILGRDKVRKKEIDSLFNIICERYTEEFKKKENENLSKECMTVENHKLLISTVRKCQTKLIEFFDIGRRGNEISIFELYEKGKLEERKGKYLHASDNYFSKVIKRNPHFSDVLFLKGRCLQKMGKLKDCIEYYEEYMNFSKSDGRPFSHRGFIRVFKNQNPGDDFKTALNLFDSALSSDDSEQNRAEILKYKGEILMNVLNNFELAKECYEEAINNMLKKGVDPDLLVSRGICYIRTGNYLEAISDFNAVLKKDHMNRAALSNRSVAFIRMKEYRKSISDSKKLLRMDGNNFLAYHNRACALFSLKKYSECLGDCNRSIMNHPHFVQSLSLKGLVLFTLRKFSSSVSTFFEVLSLDRNYSSAYLYIGHSYLEMAKFELALRYYQLGCNLQSELDSVSIFFQFHLGVCFFSLKRFSEAEEAFSIFLNEYPHDDQALKNRSIARSSQHKYEEAIVDCNTVLERNPNSVEVLRNLSSNLGNIGRCEESLDVINKVVQLELDPSPKSFCDRGLILKKMKRYSEALKDFNRSIDLNPTRPEVFRCRGFVLGKLSEYYLSYKDFYKACQLDGSINEDLILFQEKNEYKVKFEELLKKMRELVVDQSADVTKIEFENHFSSKNQGPKIPDLEFIIEQFSSISLFCSFDETKPDVCWEDTDAYHIYEKCHGIFEKFSSRERWGKINNENKMKLPPEFDIFHIQKTRRLIKNVKFKDFKIYRCIGRGVYGSAYLCCITNVPNVGGIFVLKFFPGYSSWNQEMKNLRMKKEYLQIPCHRNIVSPLNSPGIIFSIDLEKLPDYEDYWKERADCFVIKSEVLVMKYYRKDLAKYLCMRVKDGSSLSPFSNYELCLILKGLIDGIQHLHLNKIVHRDLHMGNVFVNEFMGRVVIGDFGCSLDLRNNPTGFLVHYQDKILDSGYSGSLCSSSQRSQLGGCPIFLAPEILKFSVVVNGKFLNFDKSDVFSVGMIAVILSKAFDGEQVVPTYSTGKEVELEEFLRKLVDKGDMKRIVGKTTHKKINQFIGNLVELDPDNRPSVEDLAVEIEKLTGFFSKIN